MARRQPAELTRERESHTLRVGLLQTAPVFGAVDRNLAGIAELRAGVGDVDVALTPELSANGYGFEPHAPGDVLAAGDPRIVAATAAGVGVGFAERSDGERPWNSYLLVDPVTGERLVQRKIHPVSYAPWNEHLLFQAGQRVASAKVGGATISTVICNDMWHPVIPWMAAQGGAEVLVVPVASIAGRDPEGIRRTWHVILQHTAMLLQCYVVFVNRSGADSGERFWGGSRVLGPDGSTLAALGDEPGATVVDLDLAALRQLRRDVPVLAESRADFVVEALGSGTRGGMADV